MTAVLTGSSGRVLFPEGADAERVGRQPALRVDGRVGLCCAGGR